MTQTQLTFARCTRALEQAGLAYGVLELTDGVRIVVSERGGRIFGPFIDHDTPGLFWVNPVLGDEAAFARFLAAGEWNLGGERIWIAPEIQYLVADRRDFWGTIAVPPQMDPGSWALDQATAGEWRLRQELTMTAHNLATGSKHLRVERSIRPAAEPLRYTTQDRSLRDGVIFAGYEQVVTLSEEAHDAILSQAWDVVPLQAGGQLLIPCTPAVEISDYFEPVDNAHCVRCAGGVRFAITGQRRYKVGLRAAHCFGRMGYFSLLADGRAALLVRNFFNNPSSPYADEPAHLPGGRGDSIYVYNDGGMFGGFGEMECMAQTIGGETGLSTSSDQQMLWLYVGAPEKVETIATQLLGVEVA